MRDSLTREQIYCLRPERHLKSIQSNCCLRTARSDKVGIRIKCEITSELKVKTITIQHVVTCAR